MKPENIWINKQAHLEILKDGKRLFFKAHILEMDSHSITFIDRDGIIYSFNRELITEMKEIT